RVLICTAVRPCDAFSKPFPFPIQQDHAVHGGWERNEFDAAATSVAGYQKTERLKSALKYLIRILLRSFRIRCMERIFPRLFIYIRAAGIKQHRLDGRSADI